MVWFIPNEGKEIFKPVGQGTRIVMIASITKDSWLELRPQNIKAGLNVGRENNIHEYRSIRYWQVKSDSEEEGNVVYDVFTDYFENCAIPYFPPKSIIILDNARYHRCYSSEIFKPTQASKKLDLIKYVESHGEKVPKKMKKPEILLQKHIFKALRLKYKKLLKNTDMQFSTCPPPSITPN